MSLFNSILNNIKKKYDEKNSYKKFIQEIIKNYYKINLSEESISMSNGILYIKTNPTIKVAILLKKNKLIEELIKNDIKITDIK